MVLHLFVGLLHLISGIVWFSLGLKPHRVAGAEQGGLGVVEPEARVADEGALGGLKILAAEGWRFRFGARFTDERPGNIGGLGWWRKFLPPDRVFRRRCLL
jgi:hypothetical protein